MVAGKQRGVSTVVGVTVLVALCVVLATTVFAVTSAVADRAGEPAPVVRAEADTLVAGCSGCGDADQIIEIEHVGGETVDMSAVEVLIAFEDRPIESRLVALPVRNAGCGDVEPRHYQGDHIYQDGCFGVRGALGGTAPDGTWASGEELELRIPKNDLTIDPGDEVTVTVVHESGAVVVEKTLVATDVGAR